MAKENEDEGKRRLIRKGAFLEYMRREAVVRSRVVVEEREEKGIGSEVAVAGKNSGLSNSGHYDGGSERRINACRYTVDDFR